MTLKRDLKSALHTNIVPHLRAFSFVGHTLFTADKVQRGPQEMRPTAWHIFLHSHFQSRLDTLKIHFLRLISFNNSPT